MLTLRYPRPDDAPALLALASDPAVTRFFSWGPYTDVAQPAAFIASLPQRRARGEALEFVVEHPQHGPLGITGLSEFSRRDRRCVVGSWLGHRYWGTGANREAKAMIAFLTFELLGCERLSAYAATANPRSQVALERVGFHREGTLRSWHRHGDEVHDVVMFGLLRAAWRRGPLARVPVGVRGAPPAVFVVA
jgi:ribosomal-protein-alanine N-acetyltransferase